MADGRPSDAGQDVDGRAGDAPASVPRVLDGRYQLESVLGSGGMGTVWRGLDLRLQRPVAVKVLSGDGLSLPKALERFGREARAVARLSHPNIVPVYDVGADGDDPYLVMELVDGSTVADLIVRGPLAIADVLAISSQVCDGLKAAHAAEIVHRDIKPSNLIVTAAGVVKICDFGVARLLDGADHADLTEPAVAMGSPKYMAPEQIKGDPVDARADLYGLGCSMYAMLTGQPPFSTGTPLTVAHQHVATTPQPVVVHRADTPPDVAALVADLLNKAPSARPPDAATVQARIAAAVDRRSTPGPRPRRRWAVGVLGAIVASCVLAAALIVTTHATNQSAARRLAETTGPAAAGPNVSHSTAPGSTGGPVIGGPLASPGSSPTAGAQTPQPAPAPPSPPPVDPMLALRQSIQRQADTGDLKPDAVKDLNHAVDDLAKSMATANPDDEMKKLKALRDKLTSLYRAGKLTDTGYAEINSRVDAVATQVD
jgi:serine/threonine-protein kinase